MAGIGWLALIQIAALVGVLLGVGHTWWTQQQSLPACEMTYVYSNFQELDNNRLLVNEDGYTLQRFTHAAQVNQEYLMTAGPGRTPSGFNPNSPAIPTSPVLFIPGNRGTYFQGRSMASECGRQWERWPAELRKVGLDWYHVDTKEQMSAFDGAALDRQTDFVVASLLVLKKRYNINASSHQGIVIVGHSMGGLVARMAVARAAKDPLLGTYLVSLLITEATPHQRPALPAQPSLYRFYSELASMAMPNVPIISLDGGYNDTQVGGALASLHGLVADTHFFHTSLEQVPGVWASSHHVCIVWCNQLVVRIAGMLLRGATELRYNLFNESSSSSSSTEPLGYAPPLAAKAREATMALARDYLQGNVWSQLMLREPATSTPGGAAGLASALSGSKGSECKGANLAWYRQYGEPKAMKGSLRQSHVKSKLKEQVTGLQYSWQLGGSRQPGASGFQLVTTAAKPCDGFRLWVIYEDAGAAARNSALSEVAEAAGAAAAKQAAEAGHPVNEEGGAPKFKTGADDKSVEVTHLAAILPGLMPEGRRNVRVWGESKTVMAGLDWNKTTTWAVHLPPHLLEGAAGVTLWLGTPSAWKPFQLSAQLYNPAEAKLELRGVNPLPTTLLPYMGKLSDLAPSVQRTFRGPPISTLHINLLPGPVEAALASLSELVAKVAVDNFGIQGVAAGSVRDSVKAFVAASGIWNFLVLHLEEGHNEDNKNLSCHDPLISIRDDGREYTVANLTSFSLAACHGGGSTSCTAMAVLDTSCAYRLSVHLDVTPTLMSHMILPHLGALWALAQVLVLGGIAMLRATKASKSSSVWECLNSVSLRAAASGLLASFNATALLACLAVYLSALASAYGGGGNIGPGASLQALQGLAAQLGGVAGPLGLGGAVEKVVLQVSSASLASLWLASLPLLAPSMSSGFLAGGLERLLAIAALGPLLYMAGPSPSVSNTGPAALTPLTAILVLPAVAMLAILLLNFALYAISLTLMPLKLLKLNPKSRTLSLLCMLVLVPATLANIGLGAMLAALTLLLSWSPPPKPANTPPKDDAGKSQSHSTELRLWLLLAVLQAIVLTPSLIAWIIHSLGTTIWTYAEPQDVAIIFPMALWSSSLAFSSSETLPPKRGNGGLTIVLRIACRALLSAVALGAESASYPVHAVVGAAALIMQWL